MTQLDGTTSVDTDGTAAENMGGIAANGVGIGLYGTAADEKGGMPLNDLSGSPIGGGLSVVADAANMFSGNMLGFNGQMPVFEKPLMAVDEVVAFW